MSVHAHSLPALLPCSATLTLPKYRRHRSGQARVTLPGKPRRRTVYLGKYGSPESQTLYQRVVQEWLAQGPQVQKPVGERSIEDLIEGYRAYGQEYYRHSPWEQERIELALRHLSILYGRAEPSQFGPLALKAVRQQMIVAGLSRRTINMRIAIIKRLFKWAVENELVSPSVFHGLQAVAGLREGRSAAKEAKKIPPVPDDVVNQTLPLLSRHVRAMVEVQRLSGARSGEIISMRTMDIDRTGNVWIYRPASHKTAYRGHAREIYLGPKAQAILQPFLKLSEPAAYLFSPRQAQAERCAELRRRRKSKVPPKQLSRRKMNPKRQPGARYTVRAYRRALQRACQRAQVPAWHPHQLRHSAGTHLRKEFGVEVARIILGHRTLAATEIYSELNRGQALEVIAQVG